MKHKLTFEPLEAPPIPESILGRVRKDGKPDRRYTKGLLMQQQYLEDIAGASSILVGKAPHPTATEKNLK